MEFKIDRRSLLKAGAALAATQAVPAWAQDKPTLRFAAVFSDKDIRAEMFNILNNTNLVAQTFVNTFNGSGVLSSSFGTPTAPTVNSSRQIQFGLRLIF